MGRHRSRDFAPAREGIALFCWSRFGSYGRAISNRIGFILYVNGEPVSKPEDVVAKAKKATRAIYVEGVDQNGRTFYFGFGK